MCGIKFLSETENINSQLYDRLHIYRILLGVDLRDSGGGEKGSKLLTAYH